MIPKVKFSVNYGYYNNFLNDLVSRGISLRSVKQTDYGFTAVCYASDYRKIAVLARKHQCRTKIEEKKGLYFTARKYYLRKGILLSALIFPVICFLFSCVIWRVDINAGDTRLKNILAHSLFEKGVYRGNILTKAQLDDIQRRLMLENEQLGYVTFNFYRGILTCEIYERNEKKNEKESYSSQDILCRLDGVVTDIRVYRGFSPIKPGQSVSVGDVLVSCTELDGRGRLSYSQTAAYVAGDCEKEYTLFVPYNKTIPVYTGEQSGEITASFLGKEFIIKKADLSEGEVYVKQQSITPLNLAGFYFPCTVKTATYYMLEQQKIEQDNLTAVQAAETGLQHLIEDDTKLLKEYSRQYDYRMEENGVKAFCRVKGSYIMT